MFEGGALFDPKVLDIKDEDLMASVAAAIANVAAASLELGHPTLASIPHSVVHGYKNVLAIAVETDYDFPLAEKARLTGAVRVQATVPAPVFVACFSWLGCSLLQALRALPDVQVSGSDMICTRALCLCGTALQLTCVLVVWRS